MTGREGFLEHSALALLGVEHGFGTRTADGVSQGCVIPRQVHGARVLAVSAPFGSRPPEADGLVSATPGLPIGVVTADCVPVLAAWAGGAAVAALHAGWRGLAAGVVEAGVAALRAVAARRDGFRAAVVGPHIGPCCYEVDGPVLDALASRFGDCLPALSRPSRPGRARIDLGGLARQALLRAGFAAAEVFVLPDACTRCDAGRFHSFRRDGRGAGRMLHFAIARGDAASLDRPREPA